VPCARCDAGVAAVLGAPRPLIIPVPIGDAIHRLPITG
jgi:hypothetical protein